MLRQLPGITFLMSGLSLAGGILVSQNMTSESSQLPSDSLLTAHLEEKPSEAFREVNVATWEETAIVRPNPGSGSHPPVSPMHPPGSGVAGPSILPSSSKLSPRVSQPFSLISFGPKQGQTTVKPGTSTPSLTVGTSILPPTVTQIGSPQSPTGLYYPWWMTEQDYLKGGVPAPRRPPSAR